MPSPALSSQIDADVAIIGAGYTGLAIAKRWHDHFPNQHIVLLDSSEMARKSGRNSGFLLETALAEDADADNLERVQQGNQMISETLQDMLREVELSGENVDITRAGTFRAAASDIGARSIARYETFLQAAGLPFGRLSRDELRARIGSSYFQEGLYSPHCYLTQPAQLIRALFKTLPDSVTCYENTPALQISNRQQKWQVTTANGGVNCKRLFLANNAFAKSSVSPLAGWRQCLPTQD